MSAHGAIHSGGWTSEGGHLRAAAFFYCKMIKMLRGARLWRHVRLCSTPANNAKGGGIPPRPRVPLHQGLRVPTVGAIRASWYMLLTQEVEAPSKTSAMKAASCPPPHIGDSCLRKKLLRSSGGPQTCR